MSPDLRRNGAIATRTFDLIVFDLDGVIIDSAKDLVAAAQHSLQGVGSSDPGFSYIRGCIGGGARNLLLRSLDEDKKARVEEAMSIFRSFYEKNCTKQTVLYPGVAETLAFYWGKIRLALATFKIRSATLKILSDLGVLKYFDVIVTADDVRHPKPDPECIVRILQDLRAKPDDAILVGDTPTDVRTGKNAGVSTCAVLYGIGTRSDLSACEPDFIVENIVDLKNIVIL